MDNGVKMLVYKTEMLFSGKTPTGIELITPLI